MKATTIKGRLDLVRRLVAFSNQYPWEWQPAEAEAFFDQLRSGQRPIKLSTARNYQVSLRLFCDYITDGRYGWSAKCLDMFGAEPVKVLHEDNMIVHAVSTRGNRAGGR